MAVWEELLAALEQQRGEYQSGAALARALGVSRNAVWKAAAQLRARGHAIDAAPKEGYRLLPESNVLTAQSIAPFLGEGPWQVEVLPEVTSTSTLLRERAEAGAPEGAVLIAEAQSAGRGRRARAFYSPPGGGIYMSLLLRPAFSPEEALCITTCAAVAVCRAIEALTGAAAQIKWVNDVFCHGKKVCGISTEASIDLEGGGLRYAVLGIGINLYAPPGGFPADLQAVAGSVLDGAPSGALRSRLAGEILRNFWADYPRLLERRYFEDYRRRSFLLGQPVTILRAGGGEEQAEALDLGRDFSLLVRHADGRMEALSSGEVRARPARG